MRPNVIQEYWIMDADGHFQQSDFYGNGSEEGRSRGDFLGATIIEGGRSLEGVGREDF